MKKMIFKINEELDKKIEIIKAKNGGLSKSAIARLAISKYCKENE